MLTLGFKGLSFSSRWGLIILGDPGAASWGDGIFTGERLQQERESPWAFTLTERVPEAFEIPPSDQRFTLLVLLIQSPSHHQILCIQVTFRGTVQEYFIDGYRQNLQKRTRAPAQFPGPKI